MSDTEATNLLPATAEPVRVAARRFRWFRAAFRFWLDHQEQELGCRFVLDEDALAAAFVAWLRDVEAQRPAQPADRQAYFEFAAGLMLRELVRRMPIRVTTPPTRVGSDQAAGFWPEGHACTMFCLTVARAALHQEFGHAAPLAPEAEDLRTWWSFRENAQEDPSTSVAFLDLFLGREPDWLTPGLFMAGRPDGPAIPKSAADRPDTMALGSGDGAIGRAGAGERSSD